MKSANFPRRAGKDPKPKKVVLPEPLVDPKDEEAINNLCAKELRKIDDLISRIRKQSAFEPNYTDAMDELYILIQTSNTDPHSLDLSVGDEFERYIHALEKERTRMIKCATSIRNCTGNLRKTHCDLVYVTDHVAMYIEAVGIGKYPLLEERLAKLRQARQTALTYAVRGGRTYEELEIQIATIEIAIKDGEEALAEYLEKESASASDDAE